MTPPSLTPRSILLAILVQRLVMAFAILAAIGAVLLAIARAAPGEPVRLADCAWPIGCVSLVCLLIASEIIINRWWRTRSGANDHGSMAATASTKARADGPIHRRPGGLPRPAA